MNRLMTLALTFAILAAGCSNRTAAPDGSREHRARAVGGQEVDATTSREHARAFGTLETYWFQGLAELNRFELEQSRYGEVHEGEAVMIFVTEPFDPTRQVKEEGFGDRSRALQVLKLNNYRRFYTGVYPYTIMASTFTPIGRSGPTIKLTQTVQEWCGQAFAQLNLTAKGDAYDGRSFSYFQAEGDRVFELERALLEDELYARVRLDPDALPVGDVRVLPSATFLRLAHRPWEVVDAKASMSSASERGLSDAPTRTYTIEYPELDRALAIHFEDAFPRRIVGFDETYRGRTTRGRLTRSIMLDYWNKHGNAHGPWRDALGLEH